MELKTGKILRPNQPGTKKWVEKYGNDLICVRYRYDATNNRRLKTVELVVEERAWEKKSFRIPYNKLMPIRIGYNETDLRRTVKSAGGKWNQSEKVWRLSYGQIVALGLEERIKP